MRGGNGTLSRMPAQLCSLSGFVQGGKNMTLGSDPRNLVCSRQVGGRARDWYCALGWTRGGASGWILLGLLCVGAKAGETPTARGTGVPRAGKVHRLAGSHQEQGTGRREWAMMKTWPGLGHLGYVLLLRKPSRSVLSPSEQRLLEALSCSWQLGTAYWGPRSLTWHKAWIPPRVLGSDHGDVPEQPGEAAGNLVTRLLSTEQLSRDKGQGLALSPQLWLDSFLGPS